MPGAETAPAGGARRGRRWIRAMPVIRGDCTCAALCRELRSRWIARKAPIPIRRVGVLKRRHAPFPPRSALRPVRVAAGRRPADRRADRARRRRGGRRGAGARPAVPSSRRLRSTAATGRRSIRCRPPGRSRSRAIVERIEKPRGFDGPWRIVLADGNATIQVVYFKAQPDWLKKLFPLGARLDRQRRGRMVRHAPADPASGLRAAAGARAASCRRSSRSIG